MKLAVKNFVLGTEEDCMKICPSACSKVGSSYSCFPAVTSYVIIIGILMFVFGSLIPIIYYSIGLCLEGSKLTKNKKTLAGITANGA